MSVICSYLIDARFARRTQMLIINQLLWIVDLPKNMKNAHTCDSFAHKCKNLWHDNNKINKENLAFTTPKWKVPILMKAHVSSGEITGNIFSLWNIWYKTVVLSLICLYSLVCQIHNKQMWQLVAYSGSICVWVVSCNECGGWQLGRHSAGIKSIN